MEALEFKIRWDIDNLHSGGLNELVAAKIKIKTALDVANFQAGLDAVQFAPMNEDTGPKILAMAQISCEESFIPEILGLDSF